MTKVLKNGEGSKKKWDIHQQIKTKSLKHTFNNIQVDNKYLLINRYFKSHFAEVLFYLKLEKETVSLGDRSSLFHSFAAKFILNFGCCEIVCLSVRPSQS